MDFKDPDSLNKAYELNGTDLGGYSLYVDEAKPRPDNNRDGGFSGGRGGRGWSDRGRGGGRGRGFGGRGGQGTPSTGKTITWVKNCFAELISIQLELCLLCPLDLELGSNFAGKKTTFGDDD